MINVLVTGGNGQLATCIKKAAVKSDINFIYIDVDKLDITDKNTVTSYVNENEIHWCVNCAAYTAVDKAESEVELATKVNATGAKYLAEALKENNGKFIQISTDFVFDGKQAFPYTEDDVTAPLSVYGSTKLNGEQEVRKSIENHFILRTAWLYSEFGNNFAKTMIKLGKDREVLTIVADQIGTPTYAGDLASLVLSIIEQDSCKYGLYHFSNEGVASWYDFAKAIIDGRKINCKVLPIKSVAYPTPAQRPSFSVMDKSKIKETFGIEIPHWTDSLKVCLANLND